jgi:hypothetical protein
LTYILIGGIIKTVKGENLTRKDEKMEKASIMYAYIKGDRYSSYRVIFDGNDDLNAINRVFTSLEGLQEFVTYFSNYYSIPIQYYM